MGFAFVQPVYAGNYDKSPYYQSNYYSEGAYVPRETPKPPEVLPNTHQVTPTPPITQPSAPQAPTGGGGMVPCTGPLSYGYHVDIPGGDCLPKNPTTTMQIATSVDLGKMPYTGEPWWQGVSILGFFVLLLVAVAAILA